MSYPNFFSWDELKAYFQAQHDATLLSFINAPMDDIPYLQARAKVWRELLNLPMILQKEGP